MIALAVNFCNIHIIQKGGKILIEKWTGDVVSKMHIYRVTCQEIADEMGVTKGYISMILNGRRKPEGIRQRVESAVDEIISRKDE